MRKIVKIIWLISVSLGAIYILLLSMYNYEKGYERGVRYGFEKGAWATAIYHKYYGTYGTWEYREKVLKSGIDPQTKEDIEKILNE